MYDGSAFGLRLMKVSLFVTCLVDQLFPEVGVATVELLGRLGVEVEFDRRQTCCGQPALNTGYPAHALRIARELLRTYRDASAVVIPSGSCATMIKKHLPGLFEEAGDDAGHREADELASRCHELSDFLVTQLGVADVGARYHGTVTFHDSCHQLRDLGIFQQPRTLIRAVEGVRFVEMKNSTRCCGFGGTFAVKFDEISCALGRDKVEAIERSGADFVVANDVSCLMHIGGILRRRESPIQTLHLAEFLARRG